MKKIIGFFALVLGAACMKQRPDSPAQFTYYDLAQRCDLSSAGLDSLLSNSTRRLLQARGIRMNSDEFAAVFGTTMPKNGPVDCPKHSETIIWTIKQSGI
jgi:hypothetical protein